MKEIETIEDLELHIERSKEKPVLFFKHSTSCATSARANQRMKTFIEAAPENFPEVYMIKVIESRPVSDAVTRALEVEHASPQVVLVKDGKAVWSASHYNVQGPAIEKALEKHGATV